MFLLNIWATLDWGLVPNLTVVFLFIYSSSSLFSSSFYISYLNLFWCDNLFPFDLNWFFLGLSSSESDWKFTPFYCYLSSLLWIFMFYFYFFPIYCNKFGFFFNCYILRIYYGEGSGFLFLVINSFSYSSSSSYLILFLWPWSSSLSSYMFCILKFWAWDWKAGWIFCFIGWAFGTGAGILVGFLFDFESLLR